MSKPRSVYIRRRLVVLAVLLAVVAVVVLVFLKPGSSGGVRDTEQVSVPDDLQAQAEEEASDEIPSCTAEQLTVLPITDRTEYAEGELPQLSLSVENTGSAACAADLGTGTLNFTVSSGNDEVWRSTDCLKDPTSLAVILDPGKPLTSETLEWNRERSDPDTCDIAREQVTAGGASYHLAASAGGAPSRETAQFLLH